jgi:hypothetical protein
MAKIKFEWQLEGNEAGEVFVHHLTSPRFTVKLIIEGQQPDIRVAFEAKWKDPSQGGFDWYFKALDFYNSTVAKFPK